MSQTIFDAMHIANSIMLSVAQTAGYLAAQSVVITRHLWLDFVQFDKKKDTVNRDGIAFADVDAKALFGPALEEILARVEEFIDRRQTFQEVF